MTKRGWIIFAIVCAAILGGLVFFSKKDAVNVGAVNPTSILPASADNGQIAEHVFGKRDSAVIIYEYGDFQCPGCSQAAPIIKQLTDKYKDKIGLVFRNYPLTTIHPNALAAASAAEAAGLQGKYWEMHDKLYDSQQVWRDLSVSERTDYFTTLAQNLNLDTKKFKTDVESTNVRKKIDFDIALGKKQNVTGTPAIYVNDKDVSSLHYKGDTLVDAASETNANDTPLVWSNSDAFEKLVIIPALKEHGIATN